MCSSEEEREAALDNILVEVLRLVPPLAGGRRIALRDTMLNGYAIPSGMVIHFSFLGAHTDPKVFAEPDKFRPERWNEENKDDQSKMFAFGAGPRECVGKKMIRDIILVR